MAWQKYQLQKQDCRDDVVLALVGPAGDAPSTPTPNGLTIKQPELHLVKVY